MKFSRFYVDVTALQRDEKLNLLNNIDKQCFMMLHEVDFLLSDMNGFEFLMDSDMTCDEVTRVLEIPSCCPVEGVKTTPLSH